MKNNPILDTNHWQNLKPPLCPDEREVEIYARYCGKTKPVCLLGMTKELIHLCDYMVDLNPIPQEKPVIRSAWEDLEGRAEVILGDGVLNLAGIGLVQSLSRKCRKLVCRVFLKKLEGMKYATHFPNNFPGAEEVFETQPNVAMVIWTF